MLEPREAGLHPGVHIKVFGDVVHRPSSDFSCCPGRYRLREGAIASVSRWGPRGAKGSMVWMSLLTEQTSTQTKARSAAHSVQRLPQRQSAFEPAPPLFWKPSGARSTGD